MKQLVVLRHAKTEREHPDGDRARRLTERGERDSVTAGQTVLDAVGMPERIVTSNAARAIQTAEIVAATIAFQGTIDEEPELYLAGLRDLIDIVHALPDDAMTVVLIGHNPGFLDLINWYAGEDGQRDHLPTAAFAIISAAVEHWADLGPGAASVSPVVTPRDEP
jgi:phosphohistidine phosphatase